MLPVRSTLPCPRPSWRLRAKYRLEHANRVHTGRYPRSFGCELVVGLRPRSWTGALPLVAAGAPCAYRGIAQQRQQAPACRLRGSPSVNVPAVAIVARTEAVSPPRAIEPSALNWEPDEQGVNGMVITKVRASGREPLK